MDLNGRAVKLKGIFSFKETEDIGCARSYTNLGVMYADGIRDAPLDQKKAVYYFHACIIRISAAMPGDRLGYFFFEGIGELSC